MDQKFGDLFPRDKQQQMIRYWLDRLGASIIITRHEIGCALFYQWKPKEEKNQGDRRVVVDKPLYFCGSEKTKTGDDHTNWENPLYKLKIKGLFYYIFKSVFFGRPVLLLPSTPYWQCEEYTFSV